jgi:hypothetical protein
VAEGAGCSGVQGWLEELAEGAGCRATDALADEEGCEVVDVLGDEEGSVEGDEISASSGSVKEQRSISRSCCWLVLEPPVSRNPTATSCTELLPRFVICRSMAQPPGTSWPVIGSRVAGIGPPAAK